MQTIMYLTALVSMTLALLSQALPMTDQTPSTSKGRLQRPRPDVVLQESKEVKRLRADKTYVDTPLSYEQESEPLLATMDQEMSDASYASYASSPNAPDVANFPDVPDWRDEKCPFRHFYGQCLEYGFGEPEAGWEEWFIGWESLGEVQAACSSTLRRLGQDPDMTDPLLSKYGNHSIGQVFLIKDQRYWDAAVKHLLEKANHDNAQSDMEHW